MKKITNLAAFASLLTLGFASCQDDTMETIIVSPVAGDYTGTETCPPTTGTPAPGNYQVHIYNQADANNGKVFIDNVYGIGGHYVATVDGNAITLPSTPYSFTQGSTTYRGNISATGTVDGSILTLNFKLDGPLEDDCRFVGDRNFRNPALGN